MLFSASVKPLPFTLPVMVLAVIAVISILASNAPSKALELGSWNWTLAPSVTSYVPTAAGTITQIGPKLFV